MIQWKRQIITHKADTRWAKAWRMVMIPNKAKNNDGTQ